MRAYSHGISSVSQIYYITFGLTKSLGDYSSTFNAKAGLATVPRKVSLLTVFYAAWGRMVSSWCQCTIWSISPRSVLSTHGTPYYAFNSREMDQLPSAHAQHHHIVDNHGFQEISELSSRCCPDASAVCTPRLVDDATIHASNVRAPLLISNLIPRSHSSRRLYLPNCYFLPLHQPLFIPCLIGVYT